MKFAPRLASEPLPTLCRLLGILGQSDAAPLRTVAEIERAPGFHREVGYVADYSFVVRERGTLVRINALNELRALASYAGDVDMPEPGDLVEATRSGETYGATVLLKHASEAALLADIERCQELNRADVFDVEPLPRGRSQASLELRRREACLRPRPSASTSSSSSSAAAWPTTASTCSRASRGAPACWLFDAELPTWQTRVHRGLHAGRPERRAGADRRRVPRLPARQAERAALLQRAVRPAGGARRRGARACPASRARRSATAATSAARATR